MISKHIKCKFLYFDIAKCSPVHKLSIFRMIGKNTRIWLNEGNEFHLIESTANLVNHFIKNMTITNNFVRWALFLNYNLDCTLIVINTLIETRNKLKQNSDFFNWNKIFYWNKIYSSKTILKQEKRKQNII